MKTILIASSALVVGVALGWAAALTVERGTVPADPDAMYRRMSIALDMHTDAVERAAAVTRLSKHVNEKNVEGAARAFRERASAPLLSVFDSQVFFAAWARLEQEEILTEISGWGAPRYSRIALGAVMHELARQREFERARALFNQIPEGSREQVAAWLFVTWAAVDHYEGVDSIVLSFPEGEMREAAFQMLVGQMLLAQGGDALIDWTESLPDEGPDWFKRAAFEAAVKALALHSVDDARTWVMRHWSGDEGWSLRGPEFLVESWVRLKPQAAIEWALALVGDEGRRNKIRERAFAAGMETWIRDNKPEAAYWLGQQTPHPRLDIHLDSLARHFALRTPRQAAVFANRMVGERRRERTYGTLRNTWVRYEKRDELYVMLDPETGPKAMLRRAE